MTLIKIQQCIMQLVQIARLYYGNWRSPKLYYQQNVERWNIKYEQNIVVRIVYKKILVRFVQVLLKNQKFDSRQE